MSTEVLVLTGARTRLTRLLRDLWRSRVLMGLLARQDFHAQYRRARLGMAWAVLVPLAQAAVFYVVFSKLVRFETGVDYFAFIYSGLVAWNYFQSAINSGTSSVVEASGMITKVYFPRAVLPLVKLGAESLRLVAMIVMLAGVTLWRVPAAGWNLLLLVPAVLLAALLSASFSLALSAAFVYARDVKWVMTSVTRVWFFLTPVIYPIHEAGRFGQAVRPIIIANPATGVVELFRAATIGAAPTYAPVSYGPSGTAVLWWALTWTFAWIVAALVFASMVYVRYDRVMADVL